ncbi:MAG TPA: CsgG/HfaB family protein [Candidatus Hydrogenedentes bacterium]|mgnify:CR=1 FL=1|nr:CsgG/HfaB family protein [Candidatus Hydrogenedentota bacterium]HPG68538.1 CsgG/HfaB family protein [Candidatus Hydrogenedentota bacterium]
MKKTYAWVVAAIGIGVVIWGCTTQQGLVREGQEYGVTKGVFHGRWWNYYERGCSYQAGGFHEEAAADFEAAIKMRSEDTWRARTYGMHYVEYFPNRELGIARYHLGQLDAAEQSLQRSLDQTDTDRAHCYRDLVTRKRIALGEVNDGSEPQVSTSVDRKTLIACRELPFEIRANDDVGVAAVQMNGKALPQRGSSEEVVFREEVILDEGTHEIEVAASDLADKESKETVEVVVDLTGPTIGIFTPIDPTVTENVTVKLDGVTIDTNGVTSVALSERILAESTGEPRLEFSTEMPLTGGENSFVVVAKDTAGNETRSSLKVFRGRPDSTEARLWLIRQKAPHLLAYAANGFPEMLPVLDLALAETEGAPVEIHLKSPDPERPYRHNRTLRISGDIVAKTKVASLSINGEPFETITGAPKESFNRRIPIDTDESDGENAKAVITIAATDDAGHEATSAFEVAIRPIQLNSRDSKMPVAVLAFGGSDLDTTTCDMLRVTTEMKLFDSDRFRMLDRTRLQDVLTEQQLAAALADPTQAIQLGKLTNAQVFLVADVFPRDQKGIEVKARAISAETSDIVATMDVFVEDREDSAKVDLACRTLATQVVDRFPRLSGELLSVRPNPSGDELLVSWTQEDGIVEGMYMLVVQEGEPWIDEQTGEVLEPGEIVEVSKARIDRILTSGSKAVVVQRTAEGVEIVQGMAAVTM